jgi:hypothetical protein
MTGGCVACMDEINEYIFVGKTEEKRPLGTPKSR